MCWVYGFSYILSICFMAIYICLIYILVYLLSALLLSSDLTRMAGWSVLR